MEHQEPSVRVGIPRALYYYEYFPMWRTFFSELGAEVITSEVTSRATLEKGARRVMPDTCLPVKIFVGHVASLTNRCDCIFVPAIRSVRRNTYNCSKFLGLPDLVRSAVPEVTSLLSIDVDVNKGKHRLYHKIYRLGSCFTQSATRIWRAARTAWDSEIGYRETMCRLGLTPPQAISRVISGREVLTDSESQPKKSGIAVIGHPYLLYDDYISHRIIDHLRASYQEVFTPDMVPRRELESAVVNLMGGAQWMCEDEIIGAGEYYLRKGVDGLINLMSFGCGPDSLMADIVRRQARLLDTPFINLLIDEHASESGILTRLEAFVDMINRKKRRVCA